MKLTRCKISNYLDHNIDINRTFSKTVHISTATQVTSFGKVKCENGGDEIKAYF